MCGIAGIISLNPDLPRRLPEVLGCLAHRGPDEEGSWYARRVDDNNNEWHIALGTRRLIIRAPHAGRQPSVLEGHALVFNGEISNHYDLSHNLHLDIEDVNSEPASDTVVLAQTLAQKGRDALPLLDGMFALAYMNATRCELSLAVDPFGQKPLYYTLLGGGGIAFASELSALLVISEVQAEIEPSAIPLYFLFDCIPAPTSMIRNICKIAPGTCAVWTPRGTSVYQYYDSRIHMYRETSDNNVDPIEEFRRRLALAVSRHIDSVSSPGLLLSTGIDSGLLATELARQAPDTTETYTVAYDDPTWDESKGAELVARRLGLRHHSVRLQESDVPELTILLAEKLDEPINDPANLPSLGVFRYISCHTRVVLTGDGGDELFLGYPRQSLATICKMADLLPAWVQSAVSSLRSPQSRLTRARKYPDLRGKLVNLLIGNGEELYRQLSHVWRPWLLRAMLPAHFGMQFSSYLNPERALAGSLPWPARAAYYDLAGPLPGVLLAKTDRCSMAFGVEARAPYLDRLIADYALALPLKLKLVHGDGKRILKSVLRQRLPENLVSRRKRGFGVPLAHWINTCLCEIVVDHLFASSFLHSVGLDRNTVESLVSAHNKGIQDNTTKIWSLLTLALSLQKLRTRGAGDRRGPDVRNMPLI